MALSKEEIAIRVGIDSKAVESGIGSLTKRLTTWAKSQKGFWDKSVDVHRQNLKKMEEEEVASAVRAAERSNKARRLWRERDEKRSVVSMGEIGGQDTIGKSIQMADEQSDKLFGKLKRQASSFAGNFISGAVMGVAMSIANAGMDALRSVVDKASDYISKKLYDTMYGVSERLMAWTEKFHEDANKSGRTHESTAAEMDRMDAAEARAQFEAKAAEERKTISEEAVAAAEKEYNLAKQKVEEAKKFNKEQKAMNKDNQAAGVEGIKKIAEAEAEVLAARKKINASRKDLAQAFKDIGTESKEAEDPDKSKEGYGGPMFTSATGENQFSFAQPRPIEIKSLTGMAAVDDYLSKIKSGGDAYKAKTDYSQFGKAIVQAQAESAGKTVQKVSIVEINEK